jgi:hypothetical protein
MIRVNCYTPSIIHANGRGRKTSIWKYLVNTIDNLEFKRNPNIGFVIYNNKPEESILERNLKRNEQPFYNVAVPNEEFTYMNKLRNTLNNIDNMKEEYLYILDAYDVLVMGDISNAINQLDFYQSDVIYAAERGNQRRVMKRNNCEWVSEIEIEINNNKRGLNHLNAGALFGKRLGIKRIFEKIIAKSELISCKDDQLCTRIVSIQSDEPKIDTENRVFLCLKRIRPEEVEFI